MSIDTTMVCRCGLPMSLNPHPNAGSPTMEGVEAGYVFECIPCLVQARNRANAHVRRLEKASANRRRRVRYLFRKKNAALGEQGHYIDRLAEENERWRQDAARLGEAVEWLLTCLTDPTANAYDGATSRTVARQYLDHHKALLARAGAETERGEADG